jgi:adenylate cyclase
MQAAETSNDIPLAAEAVGEVLAAHGVNSLRSRVLAWLGATPSNLPEGLLKQVEQQRQKSELTIGWLQLVIVLVLGMLYFSLPTASPAADLPSFVPLLMVAYTAFAAVRMGFAVENKVGAVLELMSILLDLILILGFIWSTHLQYAQPAAGYLKSPTMLFLFVIIALRTLSYQPWQVLFAGFAAIFGWAGLLAYALSRPGAELLLTLDYGVYSNSYAIHFGAEFQKMMALLVVTVVLTIGVARGRSLMFRSLLDQGAALRLSKFFEPELAQGVMDATALMQPGKGRDAECVAMFIDIKGFTTIAAELTSQEVLDLLARHHHLIVPIIQANRGSVSSYIGDGVLATFGAIKSNETYAADAMRAAEQVIEVFKRWHLERHARRQVPLEIGIGIDAGMVSIGIVGEGSRLQYTVIGTAVNYASKFQAHTRKDNVCGIASYRIYELAQHQGYHAATKLEVQRDQRVRGVGGQIDLVVFP